MSLVPSLLFPHEQNALLDALRRDLRAELQRAAAKPEDAEYHRSNARNNLRILEALQPKCRTARDDQNYFDSVEVALDPQGYRIKTD